MSRGRPPVVPLHGHPTAERAVACTIAGGGGNTPTTIANTLKWPKKAVENALYRLRKTRKAWMTSTKIWEVDMSLD